jgi:hypothetical protein
VQKHNIETNGEACLSSCRINFVSPEIPPQTPPSAGNDITKPLRQSGRLSTKRSYEAMQGPNKRTSRTPKKPNFATSKAASEPTTSEPVPSETIASKTQTDKAIIDEPAVNNHGITEDIEMLADNTNQPRADKLSLEPVVDIPTQVEGITDNESQGGLPTITHGDGIATLDKFFQDIPYHSSPVDGLPKSADKTADDHTDRHIHQPNTSNVPTAAQLPSITGPNATPFLSEAWPTILLGGHLLH